MLLQLRVSKTFLSIQKEKCVVSINKNILIWKYIIKVFRNAKMFSGTNNSSA